MIRPTLTKPSFVRPKYPAAFALLMIAIVCSMSGNAKSAARDLTPTRNSGPATSPVWRDYLDHAYVYSSAPPAALRARLTDYGRLVGVTLSDYIAEHYGDKSRGLGKLGSVGGGFGVLGGFGEDEQRRKAIAYLLDYLAEGNAESIRQSAHAIEQLKDRLERHENGYWYHYIRAQKALHFGDSALFNAEIFALWDDVVADLESPFATYQTLSLGGSATSGFVTTLPYLYENIARIILIRSQTLGIDQSLDALTSIVFMLADERVGSVPEIIAPRNSSLSYLDYIVDRLQGAESDGGSLTFTLALVAAERAHHDASQLLADEDFSQKTIEAIRVAIGAYRKALRHAVTLQGQSAVYVRVLREKGEIYAASQRLGVAPQIELPFGVEEAIAIYGALNRDDKGDWQQHGFQELSREQYLKTMHELWYEIQELSLNAAEYELSRATRGQAVAKTPATSDTKTDAVANERINAALGRYGDYLSLFKRFAISDTAEAVPDSAYFGAYLAHRGIAAAVLRFNGDNPSPEQIGLAIEEVRQAIDIYPFDRHLWSFLASTLEHRGREAEFLQFVKPTAQKVSRSTYVDRWVRAKEVRAPEIGAFRDALGNDLAIMYFGFTDDRSLVDLQQDLASLRDQRDEAEEQVASLTVQRQVLVAKRSELLRSDEGTSSHLPLPKVSGAPPGTETGLISHMANQLTRLRDRRDRLDGQLLGRAKALSLYEEAQKGDGFLEELASQRDQPVHTLVRRLFYEDESESRFGDRAFIKSVPRKNWAASSKKMGRPAYDRRQP